MNKREKILGIMTGVVICLGLGFRFAPEASFSLPSSISGGELMVAQEAFDQYVQTMEDQSDIRQRYGEIGLGVLDAPSGQSPSDLFSNELNDMIIREMKIAAPKLEPADYRDIENVNEYQFVEIEATVEGTLPELMKLMRIMDQRGLLIESFTLDKVGGGRRQTAKIKMDITVARLVKRQKAKRRSRRGGRSR
jgi:hypothetical protein